DGIRDDLVTGVQTCALPIYSTNSSAYTSLASIAAGRKDTLSAVTYLEKANKLNAFDTDIAVDLAAFYIKQLKFDKAVAVLNKASSEENMYKLQSQNHII